MSKPDFWKEYVRWHMLTAFFSGWETWQQFYAAESGVDQLEDQISLKRYIEQLSVSEIEYSDYLYGTNANIYLPLWASVCGKEQDALFNEVTLEVIKFYKRLGYRATDMQKNPPDYVGQQCRFLEYLSVHILKGNCSLEEDYDDFLAGFFQPTVYMLKKALDKMNSPAGMLHLEKMLLDAAGREDWDIAKPAWETYESYSWKKNDAIPLEAAYETTQCSFCDCGKKCKMRAKIQEGCVLSIEPDALYTKKRFTGCIRGHQYRHTFLSPHRLRYPMIRRGERGEGAFRRVTWEEAVRVIAEEIENTSALGTPEARYVMPASGVGAAVRGDRFIKDLLALTGGYLDYYNYYSCACAEHSLPYVYGTDVCGSSEEEMTKTKLLILWGHNPADTIWGDAFLPNLAEAKRREVRIVVIDPRKSDTALQYADQWIGILPSTDGAMVDAMAYEIWKRDLQDQKFMDDFCLGFDEDHMPDGVPKTENYKDYLFGIKDGVIKDAEWAEKITGVRAEIIRNLAIEYATTKPACLMPGLGPQRTLSGEQNCRAFAMLACLTGNVGKQGGGSGGYPNKKGHTAPSYPLRPNPYPGKIPSFLWLRAADNWENFSKTDGLKNVSNLRRGIKLVFNLASGMLINQHSNINETIRILQDRNKVQTIVISDLFMTPGARYADVLLPGVSFFETENIVPSWNASDYFLYNQKAISPVFEGRFEYEWIREAAERLGVENELSCGRDVGEWLRYLYDANRIAEPDMPDYEEFCKEGCQLFGKNEYQIAFQEEVEKGVPFQTPSGKIEIFSKRLYDRKQKELPGIPCYTPCVEGAEDALRNRYPLLLIGYHTKRRCHSIHDNNFILDRAESPALWMNPKDARKRGILNKELVDIFNDRGRIRIPVKITERIVEGAVALSEGGWYSPDERGVDLRGSINVLTMTHCATPLAKANPQHTNLVEVARSEECCI